jgi:hypothetical protein
VNRGIALLAGLVIALTSACSDGSKPGSSSPSPRESSDFFERWEQEHLIPAARSDVRERYDVAQAVENTKPVFEGEIAGYTVGSATALGNETRFCSDVAPDSNEEVMLFSYLPEKTVSYDGPRSLVCSDGDVSLYYQRFSVGTYSLFSVALWEADHPVPSIGSESRIGQGTVKGGGSCPPAPACP